MMLVSELITQMIHDFVCECDISIPWTYVSTTEDGFTREYPFDPNTEKFTIYARPYFNKELPGFITCSIQFEGDTGDPYSKRLHISLIDLLAYINNKATNV